MANDVVYYNSAETGAPVLNNAAGSLNALLYACLVTGFRALTLDSISVTANVATATYSVGHGYEGGRILEISGAATGSINGRKQITVTGAATFTFPAPGAADGAVGGAISSKRAPLGWTRPLNASNVAVYQRSDVTATPMCLRVDDSGTGVASAVTARARMIETFGADVNTFTGPTPTDTQLSGGYYWSKGANTAGAKPWVLVGDGKTFYLFLDSSAHPASSYSDAPQGIFMFGDLAPYRSGDAYGCVISGSTVSGQIGGSGPGYLDTLAAAPAVGTSLARPFNGVGASTSAKWIGTGSGRRLGGAGPTYPSPVNNGLIIQSPLFCGEANAAFSHPFRGEFRGMGDPLANISAGALHLQRLPNLGGSGRDWLMVAFQHDGAAGHAAFDVTGPWG